MKKTILLISIVVIVLMAFDRKQEKVTTYKVVPCNSQYDVTLWLNENQPYKVHGITSTGTLWHIFYEEAQ